jgi:hypothetical protein
MRAQRLYYCSPLYGIMTDGAPPKLFIGIIAGATNQHCSHNPFVTRTLTITAFVYFRHIP